jgi:GxxExxY protein
MAMRDGKASPEVEELAFDLIGAAIAVHRELGPGYLEMVYENALCVELGIRKIPYSRQHPISLNYKGHNVGEGRLDILVDNCLVVELKAVESLSPIHKAQVISYLKVTGCELGLLINFNVMVLKDGIQRVIQNKSS